MIILGLIIFAVCVVTVVVCSIIIVSPLAISILMIIAANALSLIKHNKMMHPLWDVMTVLLGILTTLLLWVDIGNEQINIGAIPFLALLIYGIVSLVVCRVQNEKKQKVQTIFVAQNVTEKPKWRKPVCRGFAIFFTAISLIGILIILTNGAEIAEVLPIVIVFGNLAVIFWAIFGRK